jgi:hypothetical protein
MDNFIVNKFDLCNKRQRLESHDAKLTVTFMDDIFHKKDTVETLQDCAGHSDECRRTPCLNGCTYKPQIMYLK